MADAQEFEARLCQSAAQGDRAAFGELVRQYQSALRSQLRRLTRGDVALADDLAQDSFLLAWRALPSFQGQARFSTWLYRIAYNCYLMHARRGESSHSTESLPDTEDADGAHDAPAVVHDASLRLDVEAALARLPLAERMALVYCYHHDLTHEEAAQVLAVPLGTLKSHVARAKARLRDMLAAWAPEKTP